MQKIGILKNQSELSILNLNQETQDITTNSISFEEISDYNLDALLVEPNVINEELSQELKKENQFYPIYNLNDFTEFEDIDYQNAQDQYQNISRRWINENNIETLENICALTKNLSTLWNKNREKFIQELWMLLRKNIKAQELTIYYHDVLEAEEQKPVLIYSVASGKKSINIEQASAAQKELINYYQEQIALDFNILENGLKNNQVVLGFNIQKSPILVMARAPKIGALQSSLLRAIVNGLN